MPTYEYVCEACQAEFEKFQSIKADPITLCPTCGQERVRRKISAGAAILFKGGGFYETDYRSAGYNEAKKKDTGEPAKPDGGKSEGKAEGKSEGKSEPKAEPAKADAPKPAESKPAESKPAAKPADAAG